jgi:methionyl-tRNA formyltransferase
MICVAGKNDIATNVLTFVVERYGAANIVAVANRDDTGKPTWQHSLIATAQRLGVKLILLQEAYELSNLHFFSVEFDRIVIPSKFRQAEIYNIHFSLLPRYKGVYTAVWPILNGDTETGVTLHRIEDGIDTGPVIHQVSIPIGINDTARDVYHACLAYGYDVLREFIPRLVEHPALGVPQSAIGSTYYGPKSIDYANLQVNLRQTAYQIHNWVRALTFQEYQVPVVLGWRVRASKLTKRISRAKPGILLEENEEGFYVSTIDFDLYLVKDYSLELIQAIEQQNLARVRELVRRVPNLEIRSRQGWSPLMIAAYTGNLAIAEILITSGADVNATNKKGTSVLMYAKSIAARSNSIELVKYLLWSGANANAIDIFNISVLDYARTEGNKMVIDCLENWLSKIK